MWKRRGGEGVASVLPHLDAFSAMGLDVSNARLVQNKAGITSNSISYTRYIPTWIDKRISNSGIVHGRSNRVQSDSHFTTQRNREGKIPTSSRIV